MRAHNVIITTSGCGHLAHTGALDRLITVLLSLKKNPIIVFGSDGDDLLRLCEQSEQCDILFDPNYQDGFFAQVKAGLHATNGAAFVVPLTENPPSPSFFKRLDQALVELETSNESAAPSARVAIDVIRFVTQNNEPLYPQVITKRGVKALLKLPSTTDWSANDSIKLRSVLAPSLDSEMTA